MGTMVQTALCLLGRWMANLGDMLVKISNLLSSSRVSLQRTLMSGIRLNINFSQRDGDYSITKGNPGLAVC